MKVIRLFLAVICVFSLTRVFGVDVSELSDDDKFLPSRISVFSADLDNSNEIRRPPGLTKNPEASIGIWYPLMEPPPVERTPQNLLKNTALIFRNVDSGTKDKFPYIVKEAATGKFYVFRNVKYQWIFEKGSADGDPYEGNIGGESGGEVWSPFFFRGKLMEEALKFIPEYAEKTVTTDAITEPKAFVNRHTVVFDSGVMDDETTAVSTLLQQVGMTLSYERAEVTVSNVTGNGYPEKEYDIADPGDADYIQELIKGTAKLPAVPADSSFVSDKVVNSIPAPYRGDENNPGIWNLGDCSAYKLVYVEDHQAPDASAVESGGQSYSGSIGQWLDSKIQIGYVDDNPNAVHDSPLKKADFRYNAGNSDIYRVLNPLYNLELGEVEPYIYFFLLRANPTFGPYCCIAQKGREAEWYHEHHPYWSKRSTDAGQIRAARIAALNVEKENLASAAAQLQLKKERKKQKLQTDPDDAEAKAQLALIEQQINTNEKAQKQIQENIAKLTAEMAEPIPPGTMTVEEYLKIRYSFAQDSNNIPLWELGVMFYVAYDNGTFLGSSGHARSRQLNAAWMDGEITKENCPQYFTLMEQLEPLTTPEASTAKAALKALAKAIKTPDAFQLVRAPDKKDRYNRFSSAGFSPELGTYFVGRNELNKDNPKVHSEQTVDIEGVTLMVGTWTIDPQRVIMPRHYANGACDCCNLAAFSSKQVVTVTQSDCCGNSVAVEAVPTSDGITIRDDQAGSLPIPEMMVVDSRTGAETSLAIPVANTLNRDELLVVKDKKSGQQQEFSSWEYDADFDLINNDYFVKSASGEMSQIAIPDNPADPKEGDRVIYEDERLQIVLNAFDNVDGMTPFRGISRTEFAMYTLDEVGNRVVSEDLEYVDEIGQVQKTPLLVRENTGDPYQFSPLFRFYHIFRKPGMYQAEYKAWEYGPAKKARVLTFNINVLEAKFKSRTIDSQQQRVE